MEQVAAGPEAARAMTSISRQHFCRLAGLGLGAMVLGRDESQAAKFKRVVIDPGHGGKDNGSKWYGVAEKTLTLDLAKRIQKILVAKGIPTTLTRTKDVFMELEDRAAVATGSISTSWSMAGRDVAR